MKLDKYIRILMECKEKHGGDIDVWSASDDEGNRYESICYAPGVRVIGVGEFKQGCADMGAYDSIEELYAPMSAHPTWVHMIL